MMYNIVSIYFLGIYIKHIKENDNDYLLYNNLWVIFRNVRIVDSKFKLQGD